MVYKKLTLMKISLKHGILKGPSMMTKFKITAFAFAVALALLVPAPSFAQDKTSPLVGVWRMTSLEVGTEGNLQPVPYSGEIIFTESGTMSVQAMNPDANVPATPYTMNGYEAYYGTVTIDNAAKTFVMTVESSLVRDLIGQNLTHVFEVSGDTLVLMPTDPAEGWRASYERF
jgi:Lipocalin-like domain